MNATVELQALALGKGAIAAIGPPRIPCADGSTASVVREEGGFLMAPSVLLDSNRMGLKDVGVSACVVPDIDIL